MNFENLTRAQASGQRFEACILCDQVLLIGDLHPDDWWMAKTNAWMAHVATDEHKAAVERTKPASSREKTHA